MDSGNKINRDWTQLLWGARLWGTIMFAEENLPKFRDVRWSYGSCEALTERREYTSGTTGAESLAWLGKNTVDG